MRRLLPLTVLFALLGGLALASPATAAKKRVNVGIANQNVDMFQSPLWQALEMKRTRHIVRWNAAESEEELERIDFFIANARANDVDVLMHISTNSFDRDKAELPSRKEYRRAVKKLIDRYYPKGVREWGVWNEANDRTQPTQNNPRRAAEYFIEMWRLLQKDKRCGKPLTEKCRVVALDLLDGKDTRLRGRTRSYIRRFYDRLGPTYSKRARFVGLHNYSDTNRRTRGGTSNVVKEVRRQTKNPRIWLTETGGIVKLGTKGDFTCNPFDPEDVRDSENDANRAVKWMFKLAKEYRNSVDRVYVYKWTGTSCIDEVRFDSGLTRLDGTPRPSYGTVADQLERSKIVKP